MRTIVVTAAGFILLASCAGPAEQTPAATAFQAASTSPTSAATPSPMATPTATPEASTSSATPTSAPSDDGELVVEGMARVIADAVVVREAPGRQSAFIPVNCYLSQPPCGQLFFGLDSGYESVYLLDGPVAADGYDWYLAATDRNSFSAEYIGWIPAGDAAGPWVVADPPDCPEPPIELAEVTFAAISELARLACLGGTELTLRGWFPASPPSGVGSEGCQSIEGRPGVCGFASGVLRPVEAPWAGDANYLKWLVDAAANPTEPHRDTWITVRGRFEHPASSECYDRGIRAVLLCRLDFVVSAVSSE